MLLAVGKNFRLHSPGSEVLQLVDATILDAAGVEVVSILALLPGSDIPQLPLVFTEFLAQNITQQTPIICKTCMVSGAYVTIS